MKLIYVGHHEVPLDHGFEPIPSADMAEERLVLDVRKSPDGELVSMKLDQGAAVWRLRDGALCSYEVGVTHLSWLTDGRLVALENRFGRCSGGVEHSLSIRDADGARTQSIPVCIPWGGVELAVASPVENFVIVYWREQSDWGYVGVDIDVGRQTELGFRWKQGGRGGGPVFTTDGASIVSFQSVGPAWWNRAEQEDDRCLVPSEGGRFRVATMVVQSVAGGQVEELPVIANLDEGWMPSDPYDPLWYQVWGPEFVANDQCVIWRPDGRHETIEWPVGSGEIAFAIEARRRKAWKWSW